MVRTVRAIALAAAVAGTTALAGCDAEVLPSAVAPTELPPRPAIEIDGTWTADGGEWTFTGYVDPARDPTDVVLEIGPGPATLRQFDERVPVAQAVVDAGPLTITTREIPDIDEICVRFSATNSAGTSVSSPLCVPHDLPSIVIDADPPTATFSTPATGTATDLNVRTYTVAWTEADVGTGVGRRSLQRRAATDRAGTCGEFEDDGEVLTDVSPVAVSDLVDGRCYLWVVTLSDGAGNTSATTSGTVRVALGSP